MKRLTRRFQAALGATALVAMGGAAQADQVILDDLIVDGSACIGQDCVNGESFGFDTLRLKENNLRIKAQDTSNSASFPTNDWQITFNDSTNGGANKFSIDDIDGGRTPFTIEASAPSNALYVDDGGRIGLGTATPVVELHVVNGDSPTLRLEQNGSSGFTPQTWDVAGNETNFFVRDATNGSRLPFRIEPNTASNALYLDSTGNVGMGTTGPVDALHIQQAGSVAIRLQSTDANTNPIRLNYNSNQDEFRITFDGSGGASEFQLDSEGNLEIAGKLTSASTCVQLDTLACTFAAGGGASCVVATCP